ncbi:MAG: cadmium-translocating P-type ATPase [Spirochaetes bacterium]|nr:cadmium-translocating P-type ATPase [Spirochaetota bacterium]
MAREFVLQGLECAGCAAKIEEAVKKMDGVKTVSINMATSKMRVEAVIQEAENFYKTIERIVHEYEPDVQVLDAAQAKKITREFVLQGLECAGCAGKIEEAVKKMDGVKSVSINMATSKMRVEAVVQEAENENMYKAIESIVHEYEPDVQVSENIESPKTASDNVSRPKIFWLAAGAAAFTGGMLFEFVLNVGAAGRYIALALFAVSYLWLGGKVLLRMARNISKGQIFDENFLMGIATLGAIAIGKYAEAVTVMLFYQVGEFFQEMAVAKSKKRISDLMNIRPDYANLKKDGQIIKVNPETVQIGDLFVVKPGEKIPLDGIVVEGESMLDTTALTGESVPRKASVEDAVLSGCINQNGVLMIRATQTFGESTVSKILDLVENAAHKKAPTETFITKFARYYTPAVVGFAVLLAVVPPLFFGGDWFDWISRALIFLVISCPCALVLSIPLGFMGGIGGASKKGILVKGGNYLEALANLDLVVFDKTGTLTRGVFKVTAIEAANGFNESELLEMTARAESFSNHPIAVSILKEYSGTIDKDSLSKYEEIAGYGVSVNANGKTIFAGNEKLMHKMGVTFTESTSLGTKVYVVVNGTFAGCVVISDEVKPDSYGLASALKEMGVRKTVMLTGDTQQIAEVIARDLRLDEMHASLLPHEKVEKLEALLKEKQPKKSLAFVGDGINDAPVLAMADVGVAMGGLGSDSAIEAADVVLMTDEPGKLTEAVKIARFTKRVVWQNIVVSLGVKFLFLFLATLGISSLWEAVFADVGVSLLAVLNSMRVMKS